MIIISNKKIKELKLKYQQAIDNIKTNEDLKRLLDTAIKFNKYPFDNIVLIHNQNPNAEFLATFDVWNNNVGRQINRGTEGLAVLELDNPKPTYRHLFELKNTNGNYSSYKKVLSYKWEVKENEKDLLIKNINKNLNGKYKDLKEFLYSEIIRKISNAYEDYFENIEITEEEKFKATNTALLLSEYMLLKKCNYEINLSNEVNIDSIKDIKIFSKVGSLAINVTRDILKDVFIQVKKLEKEKERKGELQNGREITRSNEESNSRGQNESENNTDRLGNRVFRGRGNRNMVSDVRDGGGSGNRTEPNTIWNNVERVPIGEQTPRDNNVSNDRGTQQENVRNTGNGRELQRQNDKTTTRETTNATIGQDVGESVAYDTHTSNSRGNNNQGYNRESSINNNEEIKENFIEKNQEPKEDGSFFVSKFEELDDEEQQLFNQVFFNFLRKEKIDDRKILSLTEILENDITNEEKESYIKEFFQDLNFSYYDEDLGLNIKVKSNENGITFINENVGTEFSYNELQQTIQTFIESGIYDNYIDTIGDYYNIPDEIEGMKQEISNEELFEMQYYDNEITEDFSLEDTELAKNYIYAEEHNLYDGGIKTRARKNIEIITLLKKLEEENRQATTEEQIILAGYNGFGGLANVLGNKVGFGEEYQIFKQLLTEDEFKSARKSTTTAFYTEQKIVQAMYKALENFGFEKGKILDPSMGTGNFFSVLPNKMQKSNLYGVEIDSITGRIARQLYPNANIQINGFEETSYPNNYFDVAISNIPFNNLQINDPAYNKYNFKIHDYFIAKMIDKVKPNGIVGIIATKGVLDKQDSKLREYVNQRAELVGAIRLPSNAFKQVANTEVTTDIIFFQKRERELLPVENNASWLNISQDEHGIPINNYFIENPQMILGEMVFDKSMYGDKKLTACKPFENANLEELLNKAIENLYCEYKPYEVEETKEILNIKNNIRNFSYGIINDEIYYKENNQLHKEKIKEKDIDRLKGLIGVNLALRDIINFQTIDEIVYKYTTEQFNNELQNKIQTLNIKYDKFVEKYGYINSKENIKLFKKDISLPLLTSIEKGNQEEFEKTDIFYKPTIKIKSEVKIENAEDSLKVCLNDLGRVDIEYMAKLYPKSKDEVITELGNKIFQDPTLYNKDNPYIGYVTADEYLTGYVKEKLAIAKDKASELPQFERNVKALEEVQPIPLKPSEIGFSLGSTWIPIEIYKNFIDELLELNDYRSDTTSLKYSEYIGEYFIENKFIKNIKIDEVYGTKRMNALAIIENTLNLRPIKITDKVEEQDPITGEFKKKYVLNVKETILAKAKQEEIKNTFNNWIFNDENKLEYLANIYNERFNNYVARKYDGSNLELPNISTDIILRDYQKDVIARSIYSNSNVLVAHEVGAGKTFSAIASVYEQKRLGIVKKPLIVVPNHLTGQWGKEFLRLYPNANILVANKSDFTKDNRKKFVSKIALNNFDAIIMSHSSFEKINLSKEIRLEQMEDEIEKISECIDEMSLMVSRKNDWSIKQLEILKNNLEVKYTKLYNEKIKDEHINFEELGVDSLVIDESHRYKNNLIYTKMQRVAGINTTSSNRAMDVHLKAQYISNLNNGKGVIYLTGTPITNSMSELYVLQNTLQPKDLEKKDIGTFDKWVSTFGIVEESDEIKPEGTGYQKKMRLSKFHNLPELMKMFHNIADVKTAETLDLPRPILKTGKEQIIKAELTENQKAYIDLLIDRAENIRNGSVKPEIDNFLKITLEAKLLSVDPRILDNEIPYNSNTKLNLCARKVAEIYHETVDKKSTQLIFCDSGIPKENEFNFYDALKLELIENGVSKEEIAYIHNAKTEEQKEKLFEKVRNGEIRVLIGSTEKMGVGTNVQDKLYALHNLDIPWRPDQLTQRNGRILRQGNENKEVEIFNYITEGSFDSYLYQILENKQKFITQVMTEKSPLRTCDDIDEVVLNYAEIKGLAMKNPFMKEKMQVETEINKLNLLKANFLDAKEKYKKEIEILPQRIENLGKSIENIEKDIHTYKNNKPSSFKIVIGNKTFDERIDAGNYFMKLKSKIEREKNANNMQEIGSYGGFKIGFTTTMGTSKVYLIGNKTYEKDLGISNDGNMIRIENLAKGICNNLEIYKNRLFETQENLKQAKEEIKKSFEYDERLNYLLKRKIEIDYNIENDITEDEQETNIIKETIYEENIVIENNIYNEKDMPVDKIREIYPKGTMIMLESMQGESLSKGLVGQVKNVDDMGQIHMIWQNGSGLPLNAKVDKFTILENEQNINKEPIIEEHIEEYGQDWEEI